MVHSLRAAPALALFAALLAAPPAAAREPAGQAEAPWFDQLGELAYQLYLHSNVNVINGLNLTRDQAARLLALAGQAEAQGLRRPPVRGALRADVQSVKDAFVEARLVLLAGKEVSMMADDHIGIGLQKRDLLTLFLLGKEVDEILTENQKAVVGNFS